MKWRGAAIGGGATSGSLGPAVASRNKGGQYLRSRVVPSGQTPTANQEVIRNAIRSVVPSWSLLKQSQRDAWNTYGVNVHTVDVLGDTIQLSGQNWFTGSNVLRTQAAVPLVSDAPVVFNRGGVDLTSAAIVLGASTGTLTLGMTASASGLASADAVLVFEGKDFSPGRGKYFGSFQINVSETGIPGTASSLVFTQLAAHSSSNNKAFNVVVLKGDGRYSSPARFTVTP